MPLVHIDLVEGRPPERITEMIRAVSTAIATSLDAPIASVRVVVNEMRPDHYGVGGAPWPEVVEQRRRDARGDDVEPRPAAHRDDATPAPAAHRDDATPHGDAADRAGAHHDGRT